MNKYLSDLSFAGDSDTTKSPVSFSRKFPVSTDTKPISVKSSFSKISTATAFSNSNSSLHRIANSNNRLTTAAPPPQLPGLKAAFGPYTRTRTDMRQVLGQSQGPSQVQRPAPEFAHNRSFELRLRQTESLIAEREKQQQQQQQQQPKQQRKWVSRKLETQRPVSSGTRGVVTCIGGQGSELRMRVEQSVAVSRLAESNRMAVFRSEPSPLTSAGGSAASQYVCSDCSSDMMNTSALRYYFRYCYV